LRLPGHPTKIAAIDSADREGGSRIFPGGSMSRQIAGAVPLDPAGTRVRPDFVDAGGVVRAPIGAAVTMQ